MPILPPINFKEWIEDNRELLKPPVGNKCVYEDAEFIVMVVGGPNSRKDYHYDLGEEFFYQIEGDMLLKIKDGDEFKDISIKEGEIFLLPPKTPHSPQRFENTVGLVIERTRKEDELDGFQWYCEQCGNLLYEEFLWVNDIVGQLPPIFDRFWDSMDNRTCKKCGEVQNPLD
ncbi:MAG: 3-hydroxyanthranilate 3,4-dioxygenase [Candidatus Marinimicrobia bacterium]|jgi:3-hydroxyanthranilate 3,4-dioxygenase|nr:3-hydroxyanthranilate 3,4-dioxygenase [Candidatus Neomarinimicrobiota bacterium]MDP6789915.1 3-hydroxyanthranilate 3,4-dioxygenase [Candidatus Neomarinimicrobiota bacterium]MDP7072829.1 3-hydroxyanthranilate 3,4-dioxygenase [Candidatus Neomarinimicrobiota bacterium]